MKGVDIDGESKKKSDWAKAKKRCRLKEADIPMANAASLSESRYQTNITSLKHSGFRMAILLITVSLSSISPVPHPVSRRRSAAGHR